MKVRLLASSPHSPGAQYLTTFVVNDVLAIDAGALGIAAPDTQARVRHVFLTHSHADHTATLPIFVENVFDSNADPVVIHGGAATVDSLELDVFNNRVWPDFVSLSRVGPSFLTLDRIEPEVAIEVSGLRVTAVEVDHVVPTFAYIIDDGHTSVIFGGDSGPTERIWELARGLPTLGGIFIEASFPDRMGELARLSRHLTPSTVAGEIAKMPPDTRVIAVHIKPRFRDEVVDALHALGHPRLEIGQPEATLTF